MVRNTQRLSCVLVNGWNVMNLPNNDTTNPHTTRPEVWFTRKEAAAYLKLGESTLAKLFVSGGGPPAIKIGRSVRYSNADLNAWMIQRRRRSTSDCQGNS